MKAIVTGALGLLNCYPMGSSRIDFAKLYKKYSTPALVQEFLYTLPYNSEKNGETIRSASQAILKKQIHCLEACFVAAAILENGGYPPLVVSLESQDQLDHVIYVYQKKSQWGSISRSRDEGLQGRKPVFKSLRELAASYIDPYVDLSGRIVGFGLENLENCKVDWRFSKRNLWKAEHHLTYIPHKKLNCSEKRYQRLLKRFRNGLKPIPHKSWC